MYGYKEGMTTEEVNKLEIVPGEIAREYLFEKKMKPDLSKLGRCNYKNGNFYNYYCIPSMPEGRQAALEALGGYIVPSGYVGTKETMPRYTDHLVILDSKGILRANREGQYILLNGDKFYDWHDQDSFNQLYSTEV
jgi:hypothetical protein